MLIRKIIQKFLHLTDTPASYAGEGGKAVKVKVAEDGLEFGSAGAETFLALTDTPASYTGEAGKYAKVNASEDALEFDTPSGVIERGALIYLGL